MATLLYLHFVLFVLQILNLSFHPFLRECDGVHLLLQFVAQNR
jgi:hypothetical protein